MKPIINIIGLEGKSKKGAKELRRIVEKGTRRNEKFFGSSIPSLAVVLLNTREEIDNQMKRKTPNWVVGGFDSQKNYVFILAPWAFEKESCHPKRSFPKVLIHEISHLFIGQVHPFSVPRWLVEGLASYLAEQKRPLVSISLELLNSPFLIKLSSSSGWNENANKGAYPISYYWIEFLINKYGKEKMLKFILKLRKNQEIKDAFKQIYPKSLNLTEKDFVNYLKNLKKEVKINNE